MPKNKEIFYRLHKRGTGYLSATTLVTPFRVGLDKISKKDEILNLKRKKIEWKIDFNSHGTSWYFLVKKLLNYFCVYNWLVFGILAQEMFC